MARRRAGEQRQLRTEVGDEWGWPRPGCCCGLGRHGRILKKDEFGCQGELGQNEGLNRKARKIVFSFLNLIQMFWIQIKDIKLFQIKF
jgi:hypothetical protein